MNDKNPELNFQEFTQARREFLAQKAAHAPASEKNDGKSVLYSAGPGHLFAVFENSVQDGWLYLFDAKRRSVIKGVAIYESQSVASEIDEDVVDIGWAADDSVCALALWGEFRAFLGVANDLQVCKRLASAEDDGIPFAEWPAGFDHYLEKKID